MSRKAKTPRARIPFAAKRSFTRVGTRGVQRRAVQPSSTAYSSNAVSTASFLPVWLSPRIAPAAAAASASASGCASFASPPVRHTNSVESDAIHTTGHTMPTKTSASTASTKTGVWAASKHALVGSLRSPRVLSSAADAVHASIAVAIVTIFA